MNNKRNTIIGVLLLLVTMTIGYALFSETVTIGGTAKGEGNLSIIFTNPGTGGNNINVTEHGSHGATATIKNNGKILDIQIPNMEYPTSYVEIPVKIKNDGTIKGYVKKITPEKLDTTDIKVTYTGVNEYDALNPAETKDVLIKAEWNRNSISNVTISFSLKIENEQAINKDDKSSYVPSKVYNVGDSICLNGKEDCFNVIKDNGDSVTMLAKNVLTRDGLTQTTSDDWYNVYGVAFADKNPNKKSNNQYGYWTDDSGNILPEYGSAYPVNVYNSNSNTYKIVEAYVDKLKGIKKIPQNDETSLKGRLIYMSELVELGYPSNGGYCTNKENETWLTNGQNWWSGSALSSNIVYNVTAYGILQNQYFWSTNSGGVRPVITVLKSKI